MKDRNLRQSFLGAHSNDRFHRFRVAIVGLGGGGSHIAQQCAHVGIGRYVIADGDVVEDKNLNRLIGATAQDVSDATSKWEVSSRLIKGVLPEAEIVVIKSRWQDEAAKLRDCDIVFGCIDGFGERAELETYCRRFLIPLIDIGMDVHALGGRYHVSGQVILSMPGSHCMRCMGFITDSRLEQEARRYGAAGGRPQVVWPNGVLASTAVGLAIGLVTPWSDQNSSAYLEYDGDTHVMRPSNVLGVIADRPCTHFDSKDVGDPFFGRFHSNGTQDNVNIRDLDRAA
jgi:molybdopterin-synthase adenylyltransferase